MFKILALGAALLAPCIQAYTPGACSGSCNTHDPALIKRTSDGTYFRFTTGGGIYIATASSISGSWTDAGEVLPDGSSIDLDGNTDLWAPDVHYDSSTETYYLYYAVSTFGSQDSAIGVATSTTLETGSWTDHGSTGITSSSSTSYNAIDPSFVEVASTYYLTFGSFWDDIYQVQMSSELVKRSSSSAVNIAYNASGTHALEGSGIFYRGPYYYLLFSSGICCGYDTDKPAQGAEYRIMMCRSETGTGDFVDENGVACTESGGTTLMASSGTTYGPGGQGVYVDSSLGYVLYYHYADTDVGLADADYLFGWNVLSFSNGWPTV